MKMPLAISCKRSRLAMTLLELLVAMSLLTVITLGLYLMFDRVQKAFRSGTTQVDVLEGGRSTINIIAQDLEQMRGVGLVEAAVVNTNNLFTNVYVANNANLGFQMLQRLPDGTSFASSNREVFFLTNTNGGWLAIGYRLATRTNYFTAPQNGIGTLLRFEMSTSNPTNMLLGQVTNNPVYRFNTFVPQYTNDFQPVLEGVVHMDFQIIGTNGVSIEMDTNGVPTGTNFLANAGMPAFVEFELGMVEPRLQEQVRSLPTYAAQTNFLTLPEQAGKVHLFRQRVPIRQSF